MLSINVLPASPQLTDWHLVHGLLLDSFKSMDGRIDPPSSMAAMTPEDLAAKARTETCLLAWSGERLVGCGFATAEEDVLYLSKLAVAPAFQGQGVMRLIIETFAELAKGRGMAGLALMTRVELTDNHAAFEAMGFTRQVGFRHPGYDRVTSWRYLRAL